MPRRPLPADPMVRELIQAARRTALSRRSLLTGGLGLSAAGALAACAPPPLPPAKGAQAVELPKDVSATDRVVRWANWTAYLDEDEEIKGKYPSLEGFEKKTGIKATYSVDIEDNDSYVNKVRPQLQARQDISRDIFTLTDWMAGRVIRDQLVQPLELIRMPNCSNILDALKEVSFDPGRQYSMTWQSGFAGIGYDREKVGQELSEMRDTVGLIMQQQGVDISGQFTKEQFEKAVAEVEKRVADGWIRRIKGNSYLEDLKSGNAIAGIVWSGDLFVLRAETENDNWQFVIPESGGTLWSDNMMVPITSTHRRNAQELMNYYYDPVVAAQVAAWVNYVCPVQGAQEVMAKEDPELAQSPLIFPTADFISKSNIQGFRALTPQEDADYSALWEKVRGN